MSGDRPPLSRTYRREGDTSREPGAVLQPHLFLLVECGRLDAGGARWAMDGLTEVVIGRGSRRGFDLNGTSLAIRVPDIELSKLHARITFAGDDLILTDLGSTNGSKVDGRKISSDTALASGAMIELGGTYFMIATCLTSPETSTFVEAPAMTLDPDYERALAALTRMGPTSLPVLLRGETGTGKDVLARRIHARSKRSGEFVPVNCGAIPDTLVESQLFGHTKGAFSGAIRDEPGLVRASDGGTLFLDEIGDLPKTSQAALLRVLQESEVTSVGATRAVKVDLRVVSATHKPIESSDSFRTDLYARLAGFTHTLPPLRDRRCDIGLLIADFVRDLAPDRLDQLRLAPDACAALLAYDYPLNVRELRHALSAALVFADDTITLDHLPEAMRTPSKKKTTTSSRPALSSDDERLRADLVAALTAHAGNVSEVSRAMAKTRMQIHRWMKRFGIDPETYR
jgi:transcriptional regulator of acetoin/glycerol metabolism